MPDEVEMGRRKLSPAQRRILTPMLDGKLLYGTMAEQRFADGRSWGGSGGWLSGASISYARGRALLDAGWIEHDHDSYPLGYYRITPAGRAALQETTP